MRGRHEKTPVIVKGGGYGRLEFGSDAHASYSRVSRDAKRVERRRVSEFARSRRVSGERRPRFGRHIFAIGSNEQTARLCGVSVEPTKLAIYTLAAAFVGLAGVLQFSYLTLGNPTTATGLELNVIAAVVIGGASLSGGQGSIFGSIVGALIMTTVANGCTKMELANWVQEIVTGAIIISAGALDKFRHGKNT